MEDKMKKIIIKYFGVMLLLLLAGNLIIVSPCMAASAEIAITTDADKVSVGDELTVYVTIQSKTDFGGVEADITYDAGILEYVKGSSVIAGDSGYLKLTDTRFSEGSKSKKYALKFKALKKGTSKIALDGSMVYDFAESMGMSVSSNELKVEVNSAKTASDNAYLKSLKISPSKLSPDFDKSVVKYSTAVGAKTEKLVIDATPEDNKSKVTISGNDSLKEGENKVVISVSAESGTVIEYTISVKKEAAAEKDVKAQNSVDTDKTHSLFKLVNIDGKVRAIYSGQYTLVEPDSTVQIPKGYVKQKAIISDIAINAYLKEDNMESDYFLIYASNEEGEESFYQYDKNEKTLQRYAASGVSTSDQEETDGIQSEDYQSNMKKTSYIIAMLAAICVVLVVVIIIISLKLKKYKR
jgi:hypothetical protein